MENTSAPQAKHFFPSGPNKFKDPRVTFIQETEKYVFKDETQNLSYEWDEDKKAWFPMWNEQLMASQQSAYSVEGVDETEEVIKPKDKRKAKIYTMEDESAKKKPKVEKKKIVTSVYISGLPFDTTLEEMKEVFSKYGIISEDINTGQPRIKLYKDSEGNLKGDGLVTFLKPESVELCINLLDDSDFRLGENSRIRVQKAEFKEKERTNDNNNKNPDNKRKIQQKIIKQQKKLDWFDETTGKRAEKSKKVMILKNMFTVEEIEEDPSLILDLKEDVRTECENFGEVTNVVLYEKNPEGVISVRFKDELSVLLCIRKMNGRYFAGKRIVAEVYDGKTKYRVDNPLENKEEEERKRSERYRQFLNQQEAQEGQTSTNDEEKKEQK
jgi:HIV Tat-specific factor 1